MALKIFNTLNASKKTRNGAATITLSANSASTISAAAVASIGLKAGDKISIAQDEDDERKWYIFKDPKNGFELREPVNVKSLLFNSSATGEIACSIYDVDVKKVKGVFIKTEVIDKVTYYLFILPKSV